MEASLIEEQSCYIRLTGSANNPIINKNNYEFEIGRSITLKEGKDVVIFAAGSILKECLLVANLLEEKKISTKVVNMHTIKPIDNVIIQESISTAKLIVTIEEHNLIGGLGSAVSEVLSIFRNTPPQLSLGVNDNYSKSGSYEYLKDYYGLSVNKILKHS